MNMLAVKTYSSDTTINIKNSTKTLINCGGVEANAGGTINLESVIISRSGDAGLYFIETAIAVSCNGTVNVNGGMYSGKIAIQVSLPGGTIIINNGIFTGDEAIHMDSNTNSYPGRSHSITINGGTFLGDIYAAVYSEIIINGGTFNINPLTDITGGGNVIINGEVVDNGNGTWSVK